MTCREFLRRLHWRLACFFHCFRPPKVQEEVAGKLHLSSSFAAKEKEESALKKQDNLVRRVSRSNLDEGLLEEFQEEDTGKIHLSSSFAAKEKEECAVKEQDNLVPQVVRSDLDEIQEVKLVKACGTPPVTPSEHRKAIKFSELVEILDMNMPPSTLQSPVHSIRKPNACKSPGNSPIIELVLLHWNEQEDTPPVAPKRRDINGIPNSTTKYMEDQKVCWHDTPFEERLEKALSNETRVFERKPISGVPITSEELEGQDTATSQLNTIPKYVVSF